MLSPELKQLLANQTLVTEEVMFNGADSSGNKFISPVPNAMSYDPSRHIQYNLSPQTSLTAGAFTNSTPTQFCITPGYCGEIELVTINIQCNEGGGTNTVTPVCVPYMFDRIEIGFNGSPSPVQTLYADELYCFFQQLNPAQISNLLAFNQQNMTSTAFAGETAIAASGVAYYSIPIMSVLNKLNPNTIAGNILINVWMRSNPVSSGTGTLLLTNMQLRILTRKSLVENAIANLYKTPAYIPYAQFTQATWTGTLTAGTLTEIPLAGLNGIASTLVVMVRASKSVTSSAIRTFASISGTDTFEFTGTINLVDQAKQPLLGSAALTGRDLRGRSAAFHAPSTFSSIVPIYFIYFAENFTNSVANGVNSGFCYFNNNQYLDITPGASFTTGVYTVDIYAYIYSCLTQKNGNISKIF